MGDFLEGRVLITYTNENRYDSHDRYEKMRLLSNE